MPSMEVWLEYASMFWGDDRLDDARDWAVKSSTAV